MDIDKYMISQKKAKHKNFRRLRPLYPYLMMTAGGPRINGDAQMVREDGSVVGGIPAFRDPSLIVVFLS